MNQDFFIDASTGMARRLVNLSRILPIDLDPILKEQANDELLTEADFAGLPEFEPSEREAIQTLLDFDLRAVLPGPINRLPLVVLAAARLRNIKPIVVLTVGFGQSWRDAAEQFNLVEDEDIFVQQRTSSTLSCDPDFLRDKRQGLLLIDERVIDFDIASLYSRDFPHTVVLTNNRSLRALQRHIQLISPKAPYDIVTNHNPYFRRMIERLGFTTTRAEELCFLVNVVPSLLAITATPEVSEDFQALDTELQLGHMRLDY